MNDSEKTQAQTTNELAQLRERLAELSRVNEDLQTELQERKQAEQELRRWESELLTIADNVPGLISYVGTDERFQYVNKQDEEWFGIRRGDVIGLTTKEVVGEEAYNSVGEFIAQAHAGQEVQFELTMTRDRHRRGCGLVSIVPDLDSRGQIQGYFCFLSDITEQKQAEHALRESEEQLRRQQQQLRSLASELSLAEERERRSIAADLHDHVGQTLAAAKIRLGAHCESLSTNEQVTAVNEIRALLDHAIQDTRSLLLELSPPVLYELGFESAVEWLTDRMHKQHEMTFDIHDDGQPKPLGDAVRVVLFQAVRELLFNVAKHARVSKAVISIERVDNNMRVCVQDDGVGFDPKTLSPDAVDLHGFGLFSIRERINYLGGNLEIDTQPSQGTRVTIIAPLIPDQETQLSWVSKRTAIQRNEHSENQFTANGGHS